MAEELEPLRQIFTKSVYAGATISAGTILTAEHLQLKKPGNGIPATDLPKLIGQKIRRNLEPNELISMEDIDFQ